MTVFLAAGEMSLRGRGRGQGLVPGGGPDVRACRGREGGRGGAVGEGLCQAGALSPKAGLVLGLGVYRRAITGRA